MNRSRGGKRNAVVGFLLVTALVIGGMAWATISTLRLERVEQKARLAGEFQSRVQLAIKDLDEIVDPDLAVEMGRSYKEYRYAFPVEAYDTVEGDRRTVLLKSLVADGSPCAWIELYFQVAPDGTWTSPQLPDPNSPLDAKLADDEHYVYREGWRAALRYISDVIPLSGLRQQGAGGYASAGRPTSETAQSSASAQQREQSQQSSIATKTVYNPQAQSGKQAGARRSDNRSKLEQRFGTLLQAACDPVDQVTDSLQNLTWQNAGNVNASSAGSEIAVVHKVFQPLWYTTRTGDDALAFVRRVETDTQLGNHQGFTVRWDKLKPRLLAKVRDVFPKADLVPVKTTADAAPDQEMNTLPVRLVPGEEPVVSAAAVWDKVRLTLLMSWAAAIGVLIAAGVGFRNLVALTERRLQFAYAVTHELRTPLTTFQLYSDMLAAGLVPEESKQEYVETLNKESKRLSDLVEGVLEYARLENHKVTLHPAATDGPSLMRTLADQIEERCKRHGVQLITQNAIHNGLPIRTDVELVKQVTGVLVNNACRHARDSKDPRVVVRLGQEGGKLSLDVIDSGPGIDRADARRVFRPFRRGRNAEAKAQSGIGLGLALARGWAKLLGGRLELADRNDPEYGGAHFRLTIPQQIQTSR